MKCGKFYCFKRCCLILLIIPILSLFPPINGYDFFNTLRDVRIQTPFIMLGIYIIVVNFPVIIKSHYSRPLYYEDLKDDRFITEKYKKRFQSIFIAIGQVLFSFMFASLAYYYLHKYEESRLTLFEIIGVIGGFSSLVTKVLQSMNFVMKFFHMIKKEDMNSPMLQSQIEAGSGGSFLSSRTIAISNALSGCDELKINNNYCYKETLNFTSKSTIDDFIL